MHSPAPPEVVVFAMVECCTNSSPEAGTQAELLPIEEAETGESHRTPCGSQYTEDTSREVVTATFEQGEGLFFARAPAPLEAGHWVLVEDDRCTVFDVDASLAVAEPEPPSVGPGEAISERVEENGGTNEYGYVELLVTTDAPAFVVEVFALPGGEREPEPLLRTSSSYEELRIGVAPPDCEGVVEVPAGASYEFRVAAYAADGSLGPWSDFVAIDVPAPPSPGSSMGGSPGDDDVSAPESSGCSMGRSPGVPGHFALLLSLGVGLGGWGRRARRGRAR